MVLAGMSVGSFVLVFTSMVDTVPLIWLVTNAVGRHRARGATAAPPPGTHPPTRPPPSRLPASVEPTKRAYAMATKVKAWRDYFDMPKDGRHRSANRDLP